MDRGQNGGIDIPVLCHDERYDPVGVCRLCVVDTAAGSTPRLRRPAKTA
jgi:NADH dehydrogenase/NADH:ubiquinone oxidoreductase subunit G